MPIMTGEQLASKAVIIAQTVKTTYMWGSFGNTVSEAFITAKAAQYPKQYTQTAQAALRSLIGLKVWAFDCVGLIKGLLWGWVGDASKTYGGGKYASNTVPDTTSEGMIKLCAGVSTNFTNIEIGEAIWKQGHIGIYVGEGKAVECTPSWKNGAQITAVGNITSISGIPATTWTSHGKLPWVDYSYSDTADYKALYEAEKAAHSALKHKMLELINN